MQIDTSYKNGIGEPSLFLNCISREIDLSLIVLYEKSIIL